MIIMSTKKAFCFAMFFFCVSCAIPKGSFGYKTKAMDGYRRFDDMREFDASEKVEWVYSFPVMKKMFRTGMILQKKETVWVDVKKSAQVIAGTSPFFYGNFEGMEEGEYRIVITNMNSEETEIYDEVVFRLINYESEY